MEISYDTDAIRKLVKRIVDAKLDLPPGMQKALEGIVPNLGLCAVVIPCHNYAQWLPEAIESALAQTVELAEILVVDDDSTDDTKEVVARYADRGVRYVWHDGHSEFSSRKVGFENSTGEFVAFLDADDRYPPDFVATAIPLFADPLVGVVQTEYQEFGVWTKRSMLPDASKNMLEWNNAIHAGCVARRSAMEISGAWDQPPTEFAFADWWVWRKVLEAGFVSARGPAIFEYRRHLDSMIVSRRHKSYRERSCGDLAHVTIFTPLAGRNAVLDRYTRWMDSQSWPREQTRVILLDTSGDPEFGRRVRDYLAQCDYPDTRYIATQVAPEGLADLPRVPNMEAVRHAMRKIYNRARRVIETPFALIVEDDVIPPTDVITRLMDGFDEMTAAVSASYPNRNGMPVTAWHSAIGNVQPGTGTEQVGGVGFGCLLVRRAALALDPFAKRSCAHCDYDFAFAERMAHCRKSIKLNHDVVAEHLFDLGRTPVLPKGRT